MFGRIGRERGWGPTTKAQYLNEVQHGSLYVGTPETVAKKIAYALKSVGAQRFDFKLLSCMQQKLCQWLKNLWQSSWSNLKFALAHTDSAN